VKFLIHGNAPTAKTGYGVQIALLLECLREDGHDPAVSSTHGFEGGVTNWEGFRIYGRGYDTYGNDRLHMHAAHWFGKEPGWIVTLMDVWAIQNPILADMNVAAWCPVDHFTAVGAAPSIVDFFERTNAVPIAMSRFGEEMLRRRNLDPVYIPLSVNTKVYKPTEFVKDDTTARHIHDVPEDAFLVGMVAMNKGWAKDRKGFCEAFSAFSLFEREHPDAYLYVHTENKGAAEGIQLVELAIHCGIPEHKVKWAGGSADYQYGYFLTYTDEMMAATYSSFDVLLAPSHGEGFCVPIIESMACGTPVIATNFSAQAELVTDGCGWLVSGQLDWDPPHHGWFMTPNVLHLTDLLEESYKADRATMADACIAFAKTYDTAVVYETYWKPFLAELEHGPDKLPLEREAMPDEHAVAVLCPIYKRTKNIGPLIDSFKANTDPGQAKLVFIIDEGDEDALAAIPKHDGAVGRLTAPRSSCAEKWNYGFAFTEQPWVLCIGDDVRFHEGWLDQARKLSADFDVIGTNDSPNGVRNPKVANGSHADHFFVRRAYVDEYGASLEGPGILAPEAYKHWYVDKEIVGLARARGVFSPCLESVVEHLHPGYDGDEAARQADPTYMKAVEHSAEDAETFKERWPLVQMQRTSRGKL